MNYDPINDKFVFAPSSEKVEHSHKSGTMHPKRKLLNNIESLQDSNGESITPVEHSDGNDRKIDPRAPEESASKQDLNTVGKEDVESNSDGVDPQLQRSNTNQTPDGDKEHENIIDPSLDVDYADVNSSEPEVEVNGSKSKVAKKSMKPKKGTNNTQPRGVKHLKKGDGEPFWRKDIQYDFLEKLFDDETKAFTNYFPYCDIPSACNDPKLSFSDLYIRCLAESGKCSKILKERLLKDKEMGKSVSKVCLLVNVGRMNTTVNFVPEMRSTLRTYHSIPSLQADPVYGGSKPLQDTPRLKSILKAVEDVNGHLKSLEDVLSNTPDSKPNTNLVQMLFLMSNHVGKIRFLQDEDDNEGNSFMDFFMKSNIEPDNRARRLLWLLYTYIETDFTEEGLAKNPFNPFEIPEVELIPQEKIDQFDKDTEYEVEYSQKMFQTRQKYVADEEHNSTPKRGNKSKKEREITENEDNDTSTEQTLPNDSGIANKRMKSEDANNKRIQKSNTIQANVPLSSPLTKSVVSSADFAGAINSTDSHLLEKDIIQEYKLESEIPSREGSTHLLPSSRPAGLTFPIDGLQNLFQTYKNLALHTISTENPNHIISRRVQLEECKEILNSEKEYLKLSETAFNERLENLKLKMMKFFNYKKDTSNGLLGIEWEKIRYDLIFGIESTIYQELGKMFATLKDRNYSFYEDEEGLSSMDLEKEGFTCFPIYDYNHNNESNTYLLNLITKIEEILTQLESHGLENSENRIKFDLENDTVVFASN